MVAAADFDAERKRLEHSNIWLSPLAAGAGTVLLSSLQRSRISATAERERALSHLYLAEVLDAGGNRQQAIANYKQVLSVANFEDSHNAAQTYLKRPYRRVK